MQYIFECEKRFNLGILVLFSGTPCQVAGLKAFLHKDYENLILVDLICHGVPSPKVWADYIKWQAKRFKSKIKNPNFRDLSYCWGKHYESFYVNGKKKVFDIYTKIFYSHNALRKSCFTCPYANTRKLSDITIGDYWGIENIMPEFKDEYGVSAILINSAKGQSVWQEECCNFDYFESRVEDVTKRNPNLTKPSAKPSKREEFWRDYEKGFSFIANKYGGNNLKYKAKKIIKKLLGR